MDMIDLTKYDSILDKDYMVRFGYVSQVVGLTIESVGPMCTVGDLCYIVPQQEDGEGVYVEVVGFRGKNLLLMPLGETTGIGVGSIVQATGKPLQVGVGDQLLGKVVDWQGNPLDKDDKVFCSDYVDIVNQPPNPLTRQRITEVMPLGIKAIDGMLTVGKGQRIGVFAGSGVGKSTLMGMIARNAHSDINVIALIGERGREVREFLEKDLKEEGLKRSIVVVATSDQPALTRIKAAQTATAIAEYFRDQGKYVLLLMDSLTRFAMAQREVGLAIGEPPVTRGYTPSVFAVMPKLLERAGNSENGSITGIYTVLVDGDDMNEPVTDTVRGILDGHVVLSRKLANRNHFPAIDVLQSISRVMSDIVTNDHKAAASEVKKNLAVYQESEDLINIGAYVEGSSSDIDEAIDKNPKITEFLRQQVDDKIEFEDVLTLLKDTCN
ncbi:MAG TPA: flagellar protein export ATPase FliI [Epulopiscium sp.]|nr:flagellar protein export ATPase FliI [Candidatus Epulonipiscium sp.]